MALILLDIIDNIFHNETRGTERYPKLLTLHPAHGLPKIYSFVAS